MKTLPIFHLASQQAEWLSVRQTAVANNVANANTPGYRSVDVKPFESLVNQETPVLAMSNPAHFQLNNASGIAAEEEQGINPFISGGTVRVERELAKAGEIRRDFELNTAIVKSFHRMMLMTVKG